MPFRPGYLYVRRHMLQITPSQGREWREWILVTSIPLLRLAPNEQVSQLGAGTMIDHSGCRFILSAKHVVDLDHGGWSIVVKQDGVGQLEYYRPNAFTYVGEFRRSTGDMRMLDLCAAQISPKLETWYEYRTPRGLFDKRPHHVFDTAFIAEPRADQIYGFSGRVRSERHGADAFVSDMVVYPGLTFSHTENEVHHFKLPVDHPGHEAFKGCSGAPIVDFERRLVAVVSGGDMKSNTVHGIAIQRVLPNLSFLASATSGA